MPGSPSLELQNAIVVRLKQDAGVIALVGNRVYDHVPRNQAGQVTATFPYISLGPINDVPEDADCIRASEITIQLDAWSRLPGKVETQKIDFAIRRALTGWVFSLADNSLVNFEYSGDRVFLDSDGLTTHGVNTVTAFVEVNL